MTTIVHIVNQFFAGFGGEEKAGMSVGVIEERRRRGARAAVAARRRNEIACTIYYGDNYFHEHNEEAIKAILEAVRAQPAASS